MDVDTIQTECEQAGVELVRFLYVGNDGVVRGHAVTVDHLADALDTGLPLPELVQSFNALGHRVKDAAFDAVGEVRLVPDLDTFRVLPHEDRTAAVLCSLHEIDGTRPWTADPRSALDDFLDSLDEELTPAVALESEFHLVSGSDDATPHGDRGVYSTQSMRNANDVVLDTVEALETQDIAVHKYYPEYAAGKHEIVTEYGRGMAPVDDHVFLRETVASVAETHDLDATFLPYPFDAATNGCHVHLSLWDGDRNRFAPTADDAPLSETGRHFVGGILDHADALVALTSPTVNSYARLKPQAGAAAYACWGSGNREAAVRVPQVAADERRTATRVEFRPADNTANPYLCVLGLLAAGIDGVRNEIDPGRSLERDPANCEKEELADLGVERLPTTLGEAVDALADDDVLRSALGEDLAESYLTVKRSEWEAFTDSAGTWEREALRETF